MSNPVPRAEPEPRRADPRRGVPASSTRGYRDKLPMTTSPEAGRDLQGRRVLSLPDQGRDLPRVMQTTADKLVGRVEARVAPASEPSHERRRRTGRSWHVRRPPDHGAPADPGHDRRRTGFQPRRTTSTTVALLIQGISTTRSRPVPSRRSTAADQHRVFGGAINEVVARWLWPTIRAPRYAYPALRAILLRSAGVPEALIAEVPIRAAGVSRRSRDDHAPARRPTLPGFDEDVRWASAWGRSCTGIDRRRLRDRDVRDRSARCGDGARGRRRPRLSVRRCGRGLPRPRV